MLASYLRRKQHSHGIERAAELLLDQAAFAMVEPIEDAENRVIVSGQLQQWLQFEQSELEMRQFLDAFRVDSAEVLKTLLADVSSSFSVQELETRQGDILACKAVPDMERAGVVALSFQDVSVWKHQVQRLTQKLEDTGKEQQSLKALVDAIPVPAWWMDDAQTLKGVNRAYAAIAGKPPKSFVGRKESIFQKYLSVNVGDRWQHVVVSGERKPFYLHTHLIQEGEGVVAIAIDASKEASLADELKQHMAAHADLLESSGSAMAVLGKDTRLKFYNNAFVSLWQLDESFLAQEPGYGRILDELLQKRLLPEQANYKAFREQQIKQFTDLIEPKEELFYLPDGKILRHLIIPHPAGGLLMAFEDITDRLALESSYNTLIAVQKATLDKLSEAVVVFGEDGRLRLSNPVYAKLWGFDEEFLETGPHIHSIMEKTRPLYQDDEWEHARNEMTILLNERKSQHLRLGLTNDKTLEWISVPLPDGATLMTYLDITDSTNLERSLRERNLVLQEADRLKSEFLANVSYELRSPLTSIIGFADVLKEKYFGELSGKQREYVEGISDSSAQLMHLINNILDIAYIEAGYVALEAAEFDVGEIVESAAALTRERSRDMGLQLRTDIPEKIGRMIGDKKRLMQVLFNLLSNAVKFSDNGEEILLKCRENADDWMVFSVEDRGIGIPREEQEQVFEKFHKVKNRGSRKAGTGLGLTMVRHIVELHGGRVELESAFGVGTKVRCIIPRNNHTLLQAQA